MVYRRTFDISITERIIVDDGAYFLLFLQDMFPYLDKYLVSDYLPKLTERISYVMEEYKPESPPLIRHYYWIIRHNVSC